MELQLHRRQPDVAVDDVVIEGGVDVGLRAQLHAPEPAMILEPRRPVDLRCPVAEVPARRETDRGVVRGLYFVEEELGLIRILRHENIPAVRIASPFTRTI